ncbi:MAG TPA: glycosyltransferase [Actinopolymorphaceae bacterium]
MVLRPMLEARRLRRTKGGTDPRTLVAVDPAEAARAGRPTLRIAHFSDTYLPRRDGVVTSLQTLTSAMAELGHESLLVVPRHPDQPDDDGLLRLPSMPVGVAQFRLAAWPRSRHVEKVAHWLPHAIHVHTPGPIGLLGIFAARRLGLPLVQTYHTDLRAYADAYRLPAEVVAAAIRAYARRLGSPTPDMPPLWARRSERRHAIVDAGTELLLRDSDAVLVPTPAVLTRCKLPVDDDRIYLAPAGVSLPSVPPGAGAEFRREHGIAPTDPVALFVGRVNREKGIDTLVEAFGRVVQKVPNARLLLVGAIYEQRWVNGLLESAGIVDRTVITGQLPPEQVARAYAASDVFAFPSMTDTQGLVLQEAALADVPFLLADPALYSSGPLSGTGVLADGGVADYADALTRLLTDEPYRRQVAAEAGARARVNSPASYAERMAAIYGQAVRRAASATRLARKSRGPFKGRRRLIA